MIINLKHGMRHTKEYTIWKAMKQRCENPNNNIYKYYGGRGIQVCERWKRFENFYADMGKKPSEKHTLDRIDVNGDYEPNNCRWVTMDIQARNTRVRKDSKTGVRGVTWNPRRKKWASRIMVNRKAIQLGYFSNMQDAINARVQAEKKYWEEVSAV